MSKSVSNLVWKATGEITEPVALVTCNFATDTNWIVNPIGDYTGGQTVNARYMTVDNSNNGTTVSIGVGPIPYQVNQNSRTTIPIPERTASILIGGTVGSVNLTFWTKRPDGSADGPNQFAIAQQQAITSATLNSSAMNPIINSQFSVWPEGTSINIAAAGAATYGPEGWEIARNGGIANVLVSRAVGGANAPFAAHIQRTAADASVQTIFFGTQLQSVDCAQYQGQTVVFAIDIAKGADFSAASLGVTVYAGTGTDQNIFSGFTGQTIVGTTGAVLTAAYQRITVACTFPANTNQVGILLSYTPVGVAGANDYFRVSRAQFDIGTTAPAYRPVPDELEKQRCLSFFEMTPAGFYLALGQAVSTTQNLVAFKYSARKRAIPTVTVTGTFFNLTAPSGTDNTTSFSVGSTDQDIANIQAISGGLLVAGNASWLSSLAGTIKVNARL